MQGPSIGQRARYVRLQQELGRQALARGAISEARTVLGSLQVSDFDGATVIGEICLRVLDDAESSDVIVLAALKILGGLPIRSA